MDVEKLGAFYLGKTHDLESGETGDDLVLYDSKDLTTHAMCVGMTGSGKTGLCVSVLEEAAMDGIPAIAIDPKGDLGNLMLNFPDLKSADFKPWVDPSEAQRKGVTVDAFAKSTAERWKKGLASWGQDGNRIRALKEKADVRIYTPGSTAGIPLAILRSFEAPTQAVAEDSEALQDRIQAAVSGLLALLGKTGDPIQSREHILLSNILHTAWKEGRSLDLPSLIRDIQNPPFQRVGVFDLESFYPVSDRMGLAMGINGILASPGFEDWLKGEPMDIGRMLYTPEGKPRIAVVSIAHLTEEERMFFVTVLLNEVLAWIRSQPGTSSLRAMLYMDEIYGYFPPSAMPPSKKPMLTLLKQARAYGLGIMLATQNPVDLDYKGLANTGTWFIGRLQTERDKARVLDGLEGASASAGQTFDRSTMEKVLSQLGKRVFLMHNVHEAAPTIFHTRWAMSYLRGPMTRSQITDLMAPVKKALSSVSRGASPVSATADEQAVIAKVEKPVRPMIPEGVNEYFLPAQKNSTGRLIYRPALLANTRLHYARISAKVDQWVYHSLLADLPGSSAMVVWAESSQRRGHRAETQRSPEPGFGFASLDAGDLTASRVKQWQRELKSFIYQDVPGTVWKCASLKTYSELNEDEGQFRGKLVHKLREKRDLEMGRLKAKYEKKVAMIEERIRRAEQKVEVQKSQYSQKKLQTAISVGATLVGALFGSRRSSVGKAATTMKGMSRTAREKGDIARAEEDLINQQKNLEELELKLQEEIQELEDLHQPDLLELEEIILRSRKSDLTLTEFGLLWRPYALDEDGILNPLFDVPEQGLGDV